VPRFRRQIAPGSIQHVISRFVDREHRLDAPGARQEYLRRAGRALRRSDWRALGFALMGSHVHWVLRAGDQPSSALIKPLHAGFAVWLNGVEGRLGPVFAERHRSVSFEDETAAALLAYVHNNPVRAGVVGDAADSSWTSHRMYLGLERRPPWLDVALGLHLCGFAATSSGRRAFHELVRSRAGHARSAVLTATELELHRSHVRQREGGPVEVGTPSVCTEGTELQLTVPIVRSVDCSLRPRWDGDPWTVLRVVEHITCVKVDEQRSRMRHREASEARRLALLVWTRELHRPAIEMARLLGLSSSSAAELTSSSSDDARLRAAELGRAIRTRQYGTRGRESA
jgi:hypothetical protein